ncbi:MAG: NFACT family protein [Christensenellales bacterium]
MLLLRFEAQDELGVMHPYEMYLEAMGRHSNLTLVRDGRIIDAIRHVTDDMSRVRQALPGLPFTLPPAQDKLPPECTTEAALLARLSGCTGRLDKALSGCILGLSAIAARELSFRLTGAEQAELAAVHLPELCTRLSSFLSRLPQMGLPVLLLDENGLPADVFPFLYLSYPADRQRAAGSLSAALDEYYARPRLPRPRAAALRQPSQAGQNASGTVRQKAGSAGRGTAQRRQDGGLPRDGRNCLPRSCIWCRTRAQQVTLPDYYTGGTLDIPLDVRLSPAQNAQRYFKRYQKARAAARLAAEQNKKRWRKFACWKKRWSGWKAARMRMT